MLSETNKKQMGFQWPITMTFSLRYYGWGGKKHIILVNIYTEKNQLYKACQKK